MILKYDDLPEESRRCICIGRCRDTRTAHLKEDQHRVRVWVMCSLYAGDTSRDVCCRELI